MMCGFEPCLNRNVLSGGQPSADCGRRTTSSMLQAMLAIAMLGSAESGDAPAASPCAPQVEAFIAAAKKVAAAWPWQGLIPEATPVLECGRVIAPILIAHLKYDGGEAGDLDLPVEPKVELALCLLFGITEG